MFNAYVENTRIAVARAQLAAELEVEVDKLKSELAETKEREQEGREKLQMLLDQFRTQNEKVKQTAKQSVAERQRLQTEAAELRRQTSEQETLIEKLKTEVQNALLLRPSPSSSQRKKDTSVLSPFSDDIEYEDDGDGSSSSPLLRFATSTPTSATKTAPTIKKGQRQQQQQQQRGTALHNQALSLSSPPSMMTMLSSPPPPPHQAAAAASSLSFSSPGQQQQQHLPDVSSIVFSQRSRPQQQSLNSRRHHHQQQQRHKNKSGSGGAFVDRGFLSSSGGGGGCNVHGSHHHNMQIRQLCSARLAARIAIACFGSHVNVQRCFPFSSAFELAAASADVFSKKNSIRGSGVKNNNVASSSSSTSVVFRVGQVVSGWWKFAVTTVASSSSSSNSSSSTAHHQLLPVHVSSSFAMRKPPKGTMVDFTSLFQSQAETALCDTADDHYCFRSSTVSMPTLFCTTAAASPSSSSTHHHHQQQQQPPPSSYFPVSAVEFLAAWTGIRPRQIKSTSLLAQNELEQVLDHFIMSGKSVLYLTNTFSRRECFIVDSSRMGCERLCCCVVVGGLGTLGSSVVVGSGGGGSGGSPANASVVNENNVSVASSFSSPGGGGGSGMMNKMNRSTTALQQQPMHFANASSSSSSPQGSSNDQDHLPKLEAAWLSVAEVREHFANCVRVDFEDYSAMKKMMMMNQASSSSSSFAAGDVNNKSEQAQQRTEIRFPVHLNEQQQGTCVDVHATIRNISVDGCGLEAIERWVKTWAVDFYIGDVPVSVDYLMTSSLNNDDDDGGGSGEGGDRRTTGTMNEFTTVMKTDVASDGHIRWAFANTRDEMEAAKKKLDQEVRDHYNAAASSSPLPSSAATRAATATASSAKKAPPLSSPVKSPSPKNLSSPTTATSPTKQQSRSRPTSPTAAADRRDNKNQHDKNQHDKNQHDNNNSTGIIMQFRCADTRAVHRAVTAANAVALAASSSAAVPTNYCSAICVLHVPEPDASCCVANFTTISIHTPRPPSASSSSRHRHHQNENAFQPNSNNETRAISTPPPPPTEATTFQINGETIPSATGSLRLLCFSSSSSLSSSCATASSPTNAAAAAVTFKNSSSVTTPTKAGGRGQQNQHQKGASSTTTPLEWTLISSVGGFFGGSSQSGGAAGALALGHDDDSFISPLPRKTGLAPGSFISENDDMNDDETGKKEPLRNRAYELFGFGLAAAQHWMTVASTWMTKFNTYKALLLFESCRATEASALKNAAYLRRALLAPMTPTPAAATPSGGSSSSPGGECFSPSPRGAQRWAHFLLVYRFSDWVTQASDTFAWHFDSVVSCFFDSLVSRRIAIGATDGNALLAIKAEEEEVQSQQQQQQRRQLFASSVFDSTTTTNNNIIKKADGTATVTSSVARAIFTSPCSADGGDEFLLEGDWSTLCRWQHECTRSRLELLLHWGDAVADEAAEQLAEKAVLFQKAVNGMQRTSRMELFAHRVAGALRNGGVGSGGGVRKNDEDRYDSDDDDDGGDDSSSSSPFESGLTIASLRLKVAGLEASLKDQSEQLRRSNMNLRLLRRKKGTTTTKTTTASSRASNFNNNNNNNNSDEDEDEDADGDSLKTSAQQEHTQQQEKMQYVTKKHNNGNDYRNDDEEEDHHGAPPPPSASSPNSLAMLATGAMSDRCSALQMECETLALRLDAANNKNDALTERNAALQHKLERSQSEAQDYLAEIHRLRDSVDSRVQLAMENERLRMDRELHDATTRVAQLESELKKKNELLAGAQKKVDTQQKERLEKYSELLKEFQHGTALSPVPVRGGAGGSGAAGGTASSSSFSAQYRNYDETSVVPESLIPSYTSGATTAGGSSSLLFAVGGGGGGLSSSSHHQQQQQRQQPSSTTATTQSGLQHHSSSGYNDIVGSIPSLTSASGGRSSSTASSSALAVVSLDPNKTKQQQQKQQQKQHHQFETKGDHHPHPIGAIPSSTSSTTPALARTQVATASVSAVAVPQSSSSSARPSTSSSSASTTTRASSSLAQLKKATAGGGGGGGGPSSAAQQHQQRSSQQSNATTPAKTGGGGGGGVYSRLYDTGTSASLSARSSTTTTPVRTNLVTSSNRPRK